MNKRLISVVLIALICVISISGCGKRKESPDIKLKKDSITSIVFQKSYPAQSGSNIEDEKAFKEKAVTESADIAEIARWIEGLKLTKSQAIGIDPNKIEYTIVLKGVKDHLLVFTLGKVIYDGIVYDFVSEAQSLEAGQMYNLLNYEEKDTQVIKDLNLMP